MTNKPQSFYTLADKLGDYLGEEKLPRVEYVPQVIGFSAAFFRQIEADRKALGLPPLGEEE
jgi:hypothetical protein